MGFFGRIGKVFSKPSKVFKQIGQKTGLSRAINQIGQKTGISKIIGVVKQGASKIAGGLHNFLNVNVLSRLDTLKHQFPELQGALDALILNNPKLGAIVGGAELANKLLGDVAKGNWSGIADYISKEGIEDAIMSKLPPQYRVKIDSFLEKADKIATQIQNQDWKGIAMDAINSETTDKIMARVPNQYKPIVQGQINNIKNKLSVQR